MKKCLMVLIFCILLCDTQAGTDKAQKLLNTLDLEEIVEKLEEYDVDKDGQLSELEVILQQPGIQKYLDRYAELQKAEEEEEKEEEANPVKEESKNTQKSAQVPGKHEHSAQSHASKVTQQQAGSSSHRDQAKQKDTVTSDKDDHSLPAADVPVENPAVEDLDDGVEIEVIEDIEVVEEDDTSNYKHMIPAIVVSMIIGMLMLLFVLWTRASAAQQANQRRKEEQMLQQREAWLKRMANNQPRKDLENDQSTLQEKQPPTSSVAFTAKPVETKNKVASVSPISKSQATSLTMLPKPDCRQDVGDPMTQMNERLLNVSNGNAKIEAGSTEESAKTYVQPAPKITTDDTACPESKEGDAKNGQLLQNSRAPVIAKPAPVHVEKTTDVERLKSLLEKAFSCEVILTDDILRMRFSGGKMRVPHRDFPTCMEDVESKMKVLVHQAFDKQINKVKFSVNAYNLCESCGIAFNDNLVDSTVTVIKREAINAVMSHFLEESENTSNTDSGLWGTSDGDFELNMYHYETYNFLPRLIGSSSDGVNITPAMLSLMLCHDRADRLVASLLHVGGSRFLACKRLDEILMSEIVSLEALTVLLNDAKFGDCLAKILTVEVENAVKSGLGSYFQEQSALSELLTVSTIPGSMSGHQEYQPPQAAIEPFRSLRSFPNLSHDDVNTTQAMIQKGIHELQQMVYGALRRVISNKEWREVGLSWLATLISLNQLRTTSMLHDNHEQQPVCSDGFMVNLCAVLLQFCLPISQSLEKLEKVDLGYSASPACRLIYDFEACLAGGQIGAVKGQEHRLGMLANDLQGQHNFITECFHLTQRALSVTIIPAIKRFQMMSSHFMGQIDQVKDVDQAKEEHLHNQHMLVAVAWETCLLDNDLVHGITLFYISQARLLLKTVNDLAEKHKNVEEAERAQKRVLSVVPEFCIKDMAQWFTFLANSVLVIKPNATKGIPLTAFVDCCVMLLERPDLLPGPVPASMIVSALLTFMKDTEEAHAGFHRGWGSGVMSDLAAMVHTCPSAQTKLGPALLRTYVSVDVVEGLDVDKDTFDKFNTRVDIGQLVQKLWSRSDCRASILNQCGTEMFQNFLDSILDTLLYMLHDSLSRLANVKKIEMLKANEAEWSALSRRRQAEKDLFLRNEETVGSGFMRQAKKTLKFLNLISQSEKVAHCFTRQPLATRAASTINGFLDSLCGAKAKNFKVKDMAKYEFNPVELLMDIVNVMMCITLEDVSVSDGYLVSMVRDPDFELANLEKAQAVIVDKGCTSQDTIDKLAQLMEQVHKLAAEHCPAVSSGGEDDSNWREAFIDLEIVEDELDKEYTATMQHLRFNCARIQESHCFMGKMQGDVDPRSPKTKVLMKELKQLTSSLPVNAGASIFVRQDKDRMDVMRALVTGPTGTPYSRGCFCFDIYFPSAYPNVPPLVKIITTGSGTVRFNPNLYADGKVCLSLLGTWHAGDASEKWNPSKSSLYQVLVSIQSMILTPDPIFNEPGYERIKGTEEGEVQSRQYNWKLHLHTLRHAVLGQLRNPPPGFEHVIRRHFALQREAVLKQCAEWVKGCEDPDIIRRLRQAADAIFEELMSLEVDFKEAEGDSEDEGDTE